MFSQGILEIQQDSIQNIQDSNFFYPYHSSYPHLASNDKNAGVEELGEGGENDGAEERKSEIDLREKSGGKVQWQTQFDAIFGTYEEQKKACLKASKYIIQKMGIVNISGGSDGKTIEIAKEVKNSKMQQIDYLSVNIEKAKQGISYIDEQLERGIPLSLELIILMEMYIIPIKLLTIS